MLISFCQTSYDEQRAAHFVIRLVSMFILKYFEPDSYALTVNSLAQNHSPHEC